MLGQLILMKLSQGFIPGWVLDEAWSSLDEILELISEISLDPSINAANYPNPVVLVDRQEMILQQNIHKVSHAVSESFAYHPSTEFYSVGKKAVYYAREWYVDMVKNES